MLCALGADPPVVEAEEIDALVLTLLQMHDPRLGVLELKAQFSQDQPERRERRFGLLARAAHRQQIIRVTQENPMSALGPLPVKPMQVDVAQARREDCSHASANFEFERSFERRVRRSLP